MAGNYSCWDLDNAYHTMQGPDFKVSNPLPPLFFSSPFIEFAVRATVRSTLLYSSVHTYSVVEVYLYGTYV